MFLELIICHHESVEVLVVPEQSGGGTVKLPRKLLEKKRSIATHTQAVRVTIPSTRLTKRRFTTHKEDEFDKGKVEDFVNKILSQPREKNQKESSPSSVQDSNPPPSHFQETTGSLPQDCLGIEFPHFNLDL